MVMSKKYIKKEPELQSRYKVSTPWLPISIAVRWPASKLLTVPASVPLLAVFLECQELANMSTSPLSVYWVICDNIGILSQIRSLAGSTSHHLAARQCQLYQAILAVYISCIYFVHPSGIFNILRIHYVWQVATYIRLEFMCTQVNSWQVLIKRNSIYCYWHGTQFPCLLDCFNLLGYIMASR